MDIGGINGSPADAFIGVYAGQTSADDLGLFPGCRVLAWCRGLGNRDTAKVIATAFRLIHAAPPGFRSAAAFRSLEDMGVCPATAEISAYPKPDLFDGRMELLPKKTFHSHDLARRAVSALQGITLYKGLLDRTKLFSLHQSLQRR